MHPETMLQLARERQAEQIAAAVEARTARLHRRRGMMSRFRRVPATDPTRRGAA